MADEIANSDAAPAASPVSPSVEVAAPSTSPATETNTPEATPVESVPAVESPQTDAPAEAPSKPDEVIEAAKPETLLGSEKKAEEKSTEVKSEIKSDEKAVEEKEIETAPLPEYEPFKLPEGITFDEAKMGEYTKTLAEFESATRASHEEVQKLGQQLIDRHIEEINRYTKSLTQAWNKQKNDWKDSFLKDPEFLNRTDTVVNAAIDAIGVYGGDTKQQAEFRDLMEKTGVGNHPAMIRMLSNVMLAKAEPKPLAAPQIAPKATNSKIQKMYGKKTG